MVCSKCNTFPGEPCDCCRTAARVVYIIESGRLHPSQESKALEALRFCAGALTDLVELGRGIFKKEAKAGVGTPVKTEETPEGSTKEEGENEASQDKGGEETTEAVKEEEEKDRESKRKEREEESEKPARRKKDKKEDKKDKKEKRKAIANETKIESTKEEDEVREEVDRVLKEEEAKEEIKRDINDEIEARPREFGLRSWPVRGSVARHYEEAERRERLERGPRPPDHPPPRRREDRRSDDEEIPRRRHSFGRKKNKGKKHKERGIERKRRFGY